MIKTSEEKSSLLVFNIFCPFGHMLITIYFLYLYKAKAAMDIIIEEILNVSFWLLPKIEDRISLKIYFLLFI